VTKRRLALAPQPPPDRIARFSSRQRPAYISGRLPGANRIFNRALYGLGGLLDSYVIEHHRGSQDCGDRVGDILPGKLRGAAMNRLE
jgi:hypothetical protein